MTDPGPATFPDFQIQIESPGGEPFPSISSKTLGSDQDKATLSKLRSLCRIPKKYAFSTNGKNALSDSTSLKDYIHLTPDNLANLSPETKSTETTAGAPASDAGKKPQPKGVPFVTVHLVSTVLANKPQDNLPQSNVISDLKNLLGSAGKGVDGGQLGNTAELLGKLESLQQDYRTAASSKEYTEPADLTEMQWENILFNNRILHGYTHIPGTGLLVKAPKREAFAIRRPLQAPSPDLGEVAKNPSLEKSPKAQDKASDHSSGGKKVVKEYLNTVPGIPSFYVDDDSKVTVTETRTAFQRSMAREGFSSTAIEANASGSPFGKSISASAALAEENSFSKKSLTQETDFTLEVAYKLSDECEEAIKNIKTDYDKVQFINDYGDAFPTKVVLGGFLRSSRQVRVKTDEQLEAAKEETKKAAGLSFASPQVSFGMNYAKTTSDTTTTGHGQTIGNAALTWEARGGDTVLCSNPSAWASTVKDYRYWRITEQSQTVSLVRIIDGIDPNMAHKVEFPNQNDKIPDNGEIPESELIDKATNLLMGPPSSIPMQIVNKAYQSDADKKGYNAWLKKEQSADYDLLEIKNAATGWEKLSQEQRIYYIIYVYKEKDRKVFS
ncbi:hypothetical protein Asppvi_010195 [Aspergillus pseudoviridinutans]|uniref:MACPF-like domain-containing protein n=1 Tax=Aspergillus pseudoviridinutans TaxID=1517512 RepID=A0A9P3BKY5_9EURO|nr:uncharacterized protein Asppvi_010195 [Aspergillus pseudoviridinutans]GIJ91230.1 hypothetical protein Asppvi_010195 [Aspergillus pseudoviridinutans]